MSNGTTLFLGNDRQRRRFNPKASSNIQLSSAQSKTPIITRPTPTTALQGIAKQDSRGAKPHIAQLQHRSKAATTERTPRHEHTLRKSRHLHARAFGPVSQLPNAVINGRSTAPQRKKFACPSHNPCHTPPYRRWSAAHNQETRYLTMHLRRAHHNRNAPDPAPRHQRTFPTDRSRIQPNAYRRLARRGPRNNNNRSNRNRRRQPTILGTPASLAIAKPHRRPRSHRLGGRRTVTTGHRRRKVPLARNVGVTQGR